MKIPFIVLCSAIVGGVFAHASEASKSLEIVGSSTLEPLAHVAIKKMRLPSDQSIDIHPTGSNAGIKAMCSAEGQTPISLASRRMTGAEREACAPGNGSAVSEHALGLGGIVIVSFRDRGAEQRDFSLEDLFLASAAKVPDANCNFKPNPYKNWASIDAKYDDAPIKFFGPSSTSGTFSHFVDLVVKKGALQNACMKALKAEQPDEFKAIISSIRTDEVWENAEEDDLQLVATLNRNTGALGILGFSAADRYKKHLSFAKLDGVEPSVDTMMSQSYPATNRLWMYTNDELVKSDQLATQFVAEFTSEKAIGGKGYLVPYGLISVPKLKRNDLN